LCRSYVAARFCGCTGTWYRTFRIFFLRWTMDDVGNIPIRIPETYLAGSTVHSGHSDPDRRVMWAPTFRPFLRQRTMKAAQSIITRGSRPSTNLSQEVTREGSTKYLAERKASVAKRPPRPVRVGGPSPSQLFVRAIPDCPHRTYASFPSIVSLSGWPPDPNGCVSPKRTRPDRTRPGRRRRPERRTSECYHGDLLLRLHLLRLQSPMNRAYRHRSRERSGLGKQGRERERRDKRRGRGTDSTVARGAQASKHEGRRAPTT
jgi:hypothetical protein